MIHPSLSFISLASILPLDFTYTSEISASKQMILAVLFTIIVISASLIVGLILTKVMESKGFKTNRKINLALTFIFTLILYLRFGMSAVFVQGLTMFYILLYASFSDLTSHTMDDFLWVMVAILALSSITTVGLPSMLIGAAMVFVPQMLIAFMSSARSLGGADIKLSTAIAFLLGRQKGLATLILGLMLAVVIMSVVKKVKNEKSKQPFALIPFLSAAAMIVFVI